MENSTRSVSAATPAWRIAVISFVVLTLELALIRQVPAEVRAISYFTNLLMMAAFFGLGLGAVLQRSWWLGWLVPVGLTCVAGFVYLTRGIVVHEEATSVHYWLQYAELPGVAPHLPLGWAAVIAFVISSVPFVGLGQALARAMDQHPRLTAYGWDIGGSLVGTAAFSLGAWLGLPPWVWTVSGAVLYAVVVASRWWVRIACVVAGALFLVFAHSPLPYRWSPYYFIQHRLDSEGIRLWVNSSFHQLGLDLRSRDRRLREMASLMTDKFGLPYRIYRHHHGGKPPRRVLVLGAGTGNDVNIALLNGADSITAVEIDPVIVELGRRHNSSRPYDSPRVRVVVDDARHYLWNCDERFDLVVFGTLDSQTLLSAQANLRLENYVYTAEAFRDVRRALAPGGMFAAYYSVFKPWLVKRLLATASGSFAGHLLLARYDSPFLFNTLMMGGEPLTSPPGLARQARQELAATDDWPFLYLQKPTLSAPYLNVIGVLTLLLVGAFLVLRTQHRVAGLHANFLLLGLGFTLMESAAIVRFALLFGSTWITSAVVFSSVLATIWLANWLVQRGIAPRIQIGWAGVVLFIGLNYLLPLQLFFAVGAPARVLLLALLIGLPVFFAAVCFSRLFAAQRLTGSALGMNLIGAMGGGFVEYLSMVTGMRAIWLLALAVYLGAWLATRVAVRSDTG